MKFVFQGLRDSSLVCLIVLGVGCGVGDDGGIVELKLGHVGSPGLSLIHI